ncbi:MAG: hypothetical protein ACMUJM_23555 [bacterium]
MVPHKKMKEPASRTTSVNSTENETDPLRDAMRRARKKAGMR